jgi:hypothetical protein
MLHGSLSALLMLAVLVPACGSRTGLLASENLVPPKDAGPDTLVVQCIPGVFQLERATSQAMLLLDRSGSMRFNLAGDDPGPTAPIGPNSRWRILERSLAAVLPPLEVSASVEVGATFFPEEFDIRSMDPQRACGVAQAPDVAPKRSSSAEILQVFQNTSPIGGTPTADAIESAVKSLKAASRRVVSRSIILATDGAPNCNANLNNRTCFCTQRDSMTCRDDAQNGPSRCLDDVRAVARVGSAYKEELVPTYVIGIGAQSQEPAFVRTLNEMAIAGGRALDGPVKYYDAQSPEQLSQAFDQIASSIAACNYVTPSAPTRPDAITIEVGGAQVQRDTTRRNGWDWIDKTYGQVALFGAACALASSGGASSVLKATVACE